MVSQQDKMYKLKYEAAQLYGGKCFVCEKKYVERRGFLFHHLKYIFGEPTYRDFPDTIKYNLFIIPIVLKEPNRFLLLCKQCHTTLEKLKKRKKENFLRLLIALFRTE